MESDIRRKIEETVVEILSNADLEDMTEYKVRLAAAERLGIDLSGPETKRLVRIAVENFLISAAESDQKVREEATETTRDVVNRDANDGVICKLSDKRNVAVHDFRGKTLVSIREFYWKDGKQLPTARGISLSAEQWSSFKRNVPAIEEAIRKMESKLRPELDGKQAEDVPDSGTDVPSHKLRMEIARFDGKNYKCWSQQMDLFLKQLNIAYVLCEPCPSVSVAPQASITQSKVAEQKWKNDDYICSCNILYSLSDHLFNLYSKKVMTAKELWEELKLVYLFEEYGTKRSQVKRYIEFHMVEERSILEQVQEINDIADSIVAAGMALEEKFHVSVVISKLPPSWKDVCVKLMCEEYLPFSMLMHRLSAEEESRKGKQKLPNAAADHPPDNDIPKTGHIKRELPMESKVVCHACGKKGHIAPRCRSKIWRRDKESSEKRNVNYGSLSETKETNIVSGATNS